jgi:tRNA nucleotidyltransferase/poly(A) polymerase
MKKFAEMFYEKFNTDVFYCGGFLRDKYMNRKSADIDVASAVLPQDLIEWCKGLEGVKVIETGLKHGTILIYAFDNWFEHTTFRTDSDCDGRHAEVKYTDNLYDDSTRRDFTMNSIYQNIRTGEEIDHHNGIDDIKSKIIKFVGKATDRISEDYLRIMRFFRFKNKFGFNNSPETDTAIVFGMSGPFYSRSVSIERTSSEFLKMLNDGISLETLKILISYFKNDIAFFGYLDNLDIQQKNKYHKYGTILEHAMQVYNKVHIQICEINKGTLINMSNETKNNIYLGALLHDIHKPSRLTWNEKTQNHQFLGHSVVDHKTINEICRSMKFSNATTKFIKRVILFHDRFKRIDMNSRNSIFKCCYEIANEFSFNREDVFEFMYMLVYIIIGDFNNDSDELAIPEFEEKYKVVISFLNNTLNALGLVEPSFLKPYYDLINHKSNIADLKKSIIKSIVVRQKIPDSRELHNWTCSLNNRERSK